MNSRIKKMTLKHFKGIKELELNFDGFDTNIYGKNATGKTTVNDAFTWLLFGKDSSGSAKFDVKPKNPDGTYQHGLESMVEAVLETDGTETKLARVFKEKYTKKRGSVTAEFTGHTTEFFIDDTPKSEKDFTAFTSSIIDTKTFQIITDPFFFNNDNRMKWQERRKMLLELCGDISDEAVLATHGELADLKPLIATKSIDDVRATLKSQMTKINSELNRIPDLINEAALAIPEHQEVNEDDIKAIDARIYELEEKARIMRTGGATEQKKIEVIQLQNQLAIERGRYFDVSANNMAVSVKQNDIFKIQRNINEAESEIVFLNKEIKRNEEARQKLRDKYLKFNESEFDASATICPTCGQALPEADVDAMREQFNLNKSHDLEVMNSEGVQLKQTCMKFESRLNSAKETHVALLEDLKNAHTELSALKAEANQKAVEFNAEKERNVAEIKKQIEAVKVEIAELEQGKQADISPIQNEIDMLKAKRNQMQIALANNATIERQQARIAELNEKLKTNTAEYTEKERLMFLTDEFIKAKVSMLTKNINSKFQLCRFKMFETQVNGGISECCKVTVNGVDYADLNNAMKINAGLDVIAMISDHTNNHAPIFIDNCESVNEVLPTYSQQIRLYVTNTDEQLRIEH